VEPSVDNYLGCVVPHFFHHVIETQTSFPGWTTSKGE
jgi:hypothetical protein